jgi:ribonucleoside-triphosphate reductase
MQYIKKRDGRLVQFNKNKIVDAITSAFKDVDGEITPYALDKANKIAEYVESQGKKKILNVEEVQDIVERGLMSTKRKDVARKYITYREERSRIRNWNTRMMDKVADKLAAANVQNQNANVDEYSFGGRRGEADSVIFKQYALDNIVSELAKTSRNKANEIIEQERVLVNYEQESKNTKLVKEKDIITIRGKGKFIIDEVARKY